VTATEPKRVNLTPSLAILLLIPTDVRKALKFRVPHSGSFADTGVDCLIVGVGSGQPPKWAIFYPDPADLIGVEIHQLSQKGTKLLKEGAATGDLLPELLLKWGRELGL